MSLDLRPLTLGELFDRAFMLYRRNFWLFVGITAVPGVFALVVTLAQSLLQQTTLGNVDPAGPVDVQANMLAILWMVFGMLTAAVLYFVVYMIALGATTQAVSELYLGRTAAIGQAYSRIRRRIGALLVMMILFGLRVMGLFLLAVLGIGFTTALMGPALGGLASVMLLAGAFVVFVLISLRYGVAVPALVLEGLGPNEALKRSVELTRRRLGHVFLLVLCATMVNYAALILFQGPFLGAAMFAGLETTSGMWLNLLGAVSGTIGTTMTAPFMTVGLALIYYDIRIREEAFDLEVSLASLDGAADPARA